MSWHSFINDSDIPYEQQLLEDPENITNWLRYYWHKDSTEEKLFILQRACYRLKRSYKLWMMYLSHRVELVQDLNVLKHRAEFLAVNKEFEQSLYLLNKMPLIWVKYLEFLLLQADVTLIRKCADKALRALPVTQHGKIWPLLLRFADEVGGLSGSKICTRYLIYDPDARELVLNKLVEFKSYDKSIQLYEEILSDPEFVSKEGKSPLELWISFTELLMSVKRPDNEKIEATIRNGIRRFPDQQGELYVKLAMYYIKKFDYEKARDVFEEGLSLILTIKDFAILYDSYVEFEESLVTRLMEKIRSLDVNEEPVDASKSLNLELDLKLERLEKLMDRRPFLLSDVKIRQNPNDVDEWLSRIKLFDDSTQVLEILETYVKAITTIDPRKATVGLSKIWINYSKVYEDNGDLDTARTILDKAIKVYYNSADELVEVWLNWGELELRQDNIDMAIKVMEVATEGPRVSKVAYNDDSKPPQARIHKSIKLWSFYLDLVESSGDLQKTSSLYDRVFELKIATPLTVINYANFLEDNNRFEEAFKIYERGISIFKYPVVFEIWNIYLTKALKRELNIERVRDLFDTALSTCPDDLSKPIYLLYSNYEENKGLIQRSVRILNEAIEKVTSELDKTELFHVLISKTIDHFGLGSSRPIFEKAISSLSLTSSLNFIVEFAQVESRLGEYERVRELLKYGGLQISPSKNVKLWDYWAKFEVEHGSKDTYKDMLRVKRQANDEFPTYNDDALPGFVKSSEGPKVTSITAANSSVDEKNPDEIDLDV